MTPTISRRRFLEATGATVAGAALAGALGQREASAAPLQRPNFVFFIADDLGWGDLGCYGHPYALTPNADRLAKQGTRFAGYYANHTVCSPSRAAIMTGHFPARHRIHGGLPDRNASPVDWLDASVVTLPRLLQQAGYATAHYGKWHLGSAKDAPRVTDYGFDDHRGTLSNGPGLWDDPAAAKDPYQRSKSTGRIVDLGLDFIRRRGDKPFYLHLASLVPHHPLKPTPEELAVYEGKTFDINAFAPPTREFLLKQADPQAAMRTYYASLTGWDAHLGRLLDGLEALGLAQNTVVVLTSDHGPAHESAVHPDQAGSTGPFRGRKGSLLDGGVRVPFIARGPAIPAGRVDETNLLSGVDWLPTACELASVAPPQGYASDGESRADVLRGANRPRRKPLFWERSFGDEKSNPQLAMRAGDWKLHMRQNDANAQLFNMAQDPMQSRDLAAKSPQQAAQMKAALLEWRGSLPWR